MRGCDLLLTAVLLVPGTAVAVLEKKPLISPQFPQPAIVRDQVAFWKAIFQRFTSHQVVLHDVHNPRLIIDVIDLKNPPQLQGTDGLDVEALKLALTKAYITRYRLAVDRLRQHGRGALRFGAMEERVHQVYAASAKQLRRLQRGKVKLRGQTGLADEFFKASLRAQKFLPYMEQVFGRHRVPKIITRLAFVESMFQTNARSKVGASGVWQFMPATGKIYLKVNRMVDERNNPYKATRAAAKHLASNYNKLGSWPLAITAYNHGSSGVARGVRHVGSSNLGVLIERYRSPSFGFASRNFYAEFIAAAESYDELVRAQKISPQIYSKVSSVVLGRDWTIRKIVRDLQVPVGILQKYNLCLSSRTFKRYARRRLPRGFEIFLPGNLAQRTSKRLAQLGESNKQRRLN